jgi:hypothetical protein
MSGLRNLLDTFFAYEGWTLPPWAMPAVVVALVIALWPLIRKNNATGDARKRFLAAGRETGAERARLEGEAFALVADNPVGLVVLAEEALKAGRTELATRAIDALRATKKRPDDVARLTRLLEGPQPANATDAAMKIERMLAQGMRDEARARWEKWRRRWPGDEELEGLGERL